VLRLSVGNAYQTVEDVELAADSFAWMHVLVTYKIEGSGSWSSDAAGVAHLFIDGKLKLEWEWVVGRPHPTSGPHEFDLGSGGAHNFCGMIDEVKVFGRDLSPLEAGLLEGAGRGGEQVATAPVVDAVPLTLWQTDANEAVILHDLDSQLVVSAQGPYAIEWNVLKGTGMATLERDKQGSATATLSRGEYTLGAYVSDCHFANVSALLHVSVLAPLPVLINRPPILRFPPPPALFVAPESGVAAAPFANGSWLDTGSAPTWAVSSASRHVRIDVEVFDDGLPRSPGTLTVTWTTVRGPVGALFYNATLMEGTLAGVEVIFPRVAAVYTIRASITDGELSSYSDLNVTVRGKNVLAYWPLDEMDGGSVSDAACTDGTCHNGTIYWNQSPDVPRGNPWRPGEGVFGGAFAFTGNVGREWIRFDDTYGPSIGADFGMAFWFRLDHEDDIDRSRSYTLISKKTKSFLWELDAGESLTNCHGGFKVSVSSLEPGDRLGSFDTAMEIVALTGDLTQCMDVTAEGWATTLALQRRFDKHVYNHLALSFSNGGLAIYLNGTLLDTMATNAAFGAYGTRAFQNSEDRLEFGVSSGHYTIDGLLDDIVFFDFPLATEEVHSIMNDGAAAFIEALASESTTNPIVSDASRPTIWGYTQNDMPAYERYRSPASVLGGGSEPYVVRFGNIAVNAEQQLAPHVHPRLMFGPSDLQSLRRRLLLSSKAAGAVLGSLRSEIVNWGYISGASEPSAVPNATRADVERTMKRAFVALIDGDVAEMRRLVPLLVVSARVCKEILEAKRAADPFWRDNWRTHVHDHLGALVGLPAHLGWTYDLLHPYMSVGEREEVREFIALASSGFSSVGMNNVGGVSTSNWIPLVTYDLIQLIRAIEDEPGYDHAVAAELKRTVDRYNTAGVFDSGATYEGEGKAALSAQGVLEMSRRWNSESMGTSVATLRQHVAHFLLHRMSPWGGDSFDRDEVLGCEEAKATAADIVAAKHFFPANPRIDFVFRNVLSGGRPECSRATYSGTCSPVRVAEYDPPNIRGKVGSFEHTLSALIVAQDTNLSAQSMEQAWREIGTIAGKTYICCRRGILITRSEWKQSATHVTFQPRSVSGGHSQPNRGYFLLKALGRTWVAYADSYDYGHASALTIDGVGPSALPGTFLSFHDEPIVTLAAANLTLPYVRVGAQGNDGYIELYNLSPQDLQGSVCPMEAGWIADDNDITTPAVPMRPEEWNSGWRARPIRYTADWGGGRATASYLGIERGKQTKLNFHIQSVPLKSYVRTVALVRGGTLAGYTTVVDSVAFGCTAIASAYGCNTSVVKLTNLSSPITLPSDLQGNARTAPGQPNASVTDTETGNRLAVHAVLLTGLTVQEDLQDDSSLQAELRLAAQLPPSSFVPYVPAAPRPEWWYWEGMDTPSVANGQQPGTFRRLQANVSVSPQLGDVDILTLLFPLPLGASDPIITPKVSPKAPGFVVVDVQFDDISTDRLWFARRVGVASPLVAVTRLTTSGDAESFAFPTAYNLPPPPPPQPPRTAPSPTASPLHQPPSPPPLPPPWKQHPPPELYQDESRWGFKSGFDVTGFKTKMNAYEALKRYKANVFPRFFSRSTAPAYEEALHLILEDP